MSTPRRPFTSLPAAVKQAVGHLTGTVHSARSVRGGCNAGVAAWLETDSGDVFLKGVHAAHPMAETLQAEARINTYLPRASPRLRWQLEVGRWVLLGYQAIRGRHADYRRGSDDLRLVREAVHEVQCLRAPLDMEMGRAEERWAEHAPEGTAGLFAGDTLLHTDLTPENVLISDRAHLVDWSSPTRGAAWIDPALLVVSLVDAGHTVEDADALAGGFASWVTACPRAKAAFAMANARQWESAATKERTAWRHRMARNAAAVSHHFSFR